MFIKSIISVLIVTSAFAIVFGQTPEAKKEKAAAAQTFAFSFDGDGSYLGIQTQEVTRDNFSKLGLGEVRGVAIEKVVENSPAAAAGLQAGDVILRFNGQDVSSTRALTRVLGEVAPDHQVTITISRGGHEQEMTATVGKRPVPKFEEGNFNFSMPAMPEGDWEKLKEMPQLKNMPDLKNLPGGEALQVFGVPEGDGKAFVWRTGQGRQIGVGISPLTKQLAEHFGVDGGVMISEVRENSPAAKAGLKAGDIIVEINGKAVKGEGDLLRAINDKKEGDVTLTIVRDRNRQTISVTPEVSKDNGFFYETGDEDGLNMPSPSPLRMVMPTMPATPMVAPVPMVAPAPMTPLAPMTAPAPMTLLRSGRII